MQQAEFVDVQFSTCVIGLCSLPADFAVPKTALSMKGYWYSYARSYVFQIMCSIVAYP